MKRRPEKPGPPQRGADPSADELDLWARATADVRPLGEGTKPVVSRLRKPLPVAEAITDPTPRGPVFDVDDGAGEGRAEGVDRGTLAALRRGEHRYQSTVDLHGMSRDRAEAALAAGLSGALARQERCVLVVHGRGRNSEAGPVLKDALPAWLTRGALAPLVLAFAPAVARDGGPGATYVLLRRADRAGRRAGRGEPPYRPGGTT